MAYRTSSTRLCSCNLDSVPDVVLHRAVGENQRVGDLPI